MPNHFAGRKWPNSCRVTNIDKLKINCIAIIRYSIGMKIDLRIKS
jgi:hypothetical protein